MPLATMAANIHIITAASPWPQRKPECMRISRKLASPSQVCAMSHVFTRPRRDAGYFLRSPSTHSNTMIPVPRDANNSPMNVPPRAPLGESTAYAI